ncbi:FlgD immunoglobulin-like domain containing protein [Streptomyces xantholiticus]
MGLMLSVGEVAAEEAVTKVVIPPTMRTTPGYLSFLTAGPSGVLHKSTTPGYDGLEWTSGDGATRKVTGTDGRNSYGTAYYYGAASDTIALPARDGSGTVLLRDVVTGEESVVKVPADQLYNGTVGNLVLTQGGRQANATTTEVHLLHAEGGATVDRKVTGLPAGAYAHFVLRAGVRGAMLDYQIPGDSTRKYAWIDYESASAVPLPQGTVYQNRVTAHHVITAGVGGITVYEQGKFEAPLHVVRAPLNDAEFVGVVGDSAILARYDASLGKKSHSSANWRLVAVPFDGSAERTLAKRAFIDRLVIHPDGGVVLQAGDSAEDFGVVAVTASTEGRPTVRQVKRIPPVPMQMYGLVLDEGRVTTLEYGDGVTSVYERELLGTPPGYGERTRRGSLTVPYGGCSRYSGTCPPLHPTGDGGIVYLGFVQSETATVKKIFFVESGAAFPGRPVETGLSEQGPTQDLEILDVSGDLVLVRGKSDEGVDEVRVVALGDGKVLRTAAPGVHALWGTTLWSVGAEPGSVTATDVRSGGHAAAVTVAAGCGAVTHLEAYGRWLYWKCSPAVEGNAWKNGVYDHLREKSVPLPGLNTSREVILGDGVVIAPGSLGLPTAYDVHSGSAVERLIPASAGHVTADPESGQVAYTRSDGVHVEDLGIPRTPLSSLYSVVAPTVRTGATPAAWQGEWWLSEPASSWAVTVRHKATGRTVRTWGGGAAAHSLATSWDGRDESGRLLTNGAYTWALTVRPTDGAGPALQLSGSLMLSGGLTADFGTFRSVQPKRLMDTRTGLGVPQAKVGAGRTVTLQVTGEGGVPTTGVTAVVMNVTATTVTGTTYVSVYPNGTQRTSASNLNVKAGETRPNLVVVPVVNGKVSFYNNAGSVNLIADVAGYYTATGEGSTYEPVTPTRFMDTRTGLGVPQAKVGAGRTVTLQVTGKHGLPASGVTGVVMNVTGTTATATTYVSVYPNGSTRTSASSLNLVAGQTAPNLVVVPVVNGKVSFYNNAGSVNLIADVAGYFTSAGDGSEYKPVTPTRFMDTRTGLGVPQAKVGAGRTVTLQVTGKNGVPATGVTAVVMNVTGTTVTGTTYVSVYPSGTTRTSASNLNLVAGQTAPNLVVVPVVNGKVSFYNNAGSVNLVADVAGYYTG